MRYDSHQRFDGRTSELTSISTPSPLFVRLMACAICSTVLFGCGADFGSDGTMARPSAGSLALETTNPDTIPVDTDVTDTVLVETTAVDTFPVRTTVDATSDLPLALDVLAMIPVESEHRGGYSRKLFEHWTITGGCSTREQVLIRDSVTPAQVDIFGCRVVAGDWLSAYDGARWDNPSDVDIDHVVALKEAWDSGAWAWNDDRRRAFANDLIDARTLRAVTDDVNQAKGDKDPSNWMPPEQSFWCEYLGDWIAIKMRWSLSMDQSEAGRIRKLLTGQCVDLRIAPVVPA